MESLTRAGITALVAAVTLIAPVSGTYALLNGTQQADAHMTVSAVGAQTRLDIVETKSGTTQAITAYKVDMSKLMHLVIVSSDLTQFMHVHPVLDETTGHFTVSVALACGRNYYAYADTQPVGLQQQVFRFAIKQTARRESVSSMTPSPVTMQAGPYSVTLGATTLRANQPAALSVTIKKSGQLANDLHPYLGAAGHAVFINTASLTYVHVHPVLKGAMDDDMPGMDMRSMASPAGPEMMLHVPKLPAGTYKLWLQFRGGSGLYVAPFTIVAR